MKRLRLFQTALLSITAFVSFCQDIKLLQQQYKSAYTFKDKIYALDGLANYYTWTEGGYIEAKNYGEQMVSLATESKSNELLALAYVLNGLRLVEGIPSTQREKELRLYFDKAIQIAKENRLPFYEAAAYIGLSGIQFHIVLGDGDELLNWGKQSFKLSSAIANDSLKVMSLIALANGHRFKKDNVRAFRLFIEGLELAEKNHHPYLLAYCYRAFARFYDGLGDFNKAVYYFTKAKETLQKKSDLSYRDLNWLYFTQVNTTWSYSSKKEHQQARESANKVMEIAKEYNLPSTYKAGPLHVHFTLFVNEGKYQEAKAFYQQNRFLEAFYKNHDFENTLFSRMALIYRNTNQPDSADHYYKLSLAVIDKSVPIWSPGAYREYGTFLLERGKLRQAVWHLQIAKRRSEQFKDFNNLVTSYNDLNKVYLKMGDIAKAYTYQSLYLQAKDSLALLSKEKDLALIEIQQEQKKLEQEQLERQAITEYRNRIRTFGFAAGLLILLIVAAILWRNNRNKQKANLLLQKQKHETEQQKAKAVERLEALKSAQAQLVHREKMASLGELTAGIAHEIQNPLNFVNNFSEVNTELIAEMKDEIEKGNMEEIKALANDIEENELKITHHGKRADAIVKGMLLHSRTSTGKKEPTDINALADEYLRLSYHGLRAKDKSFDANFKTDFDKSISLVDVIPQDIGRVLLNLYNNAFYSVNEKKKQLDGAFEPGVSVSTKKSSDLVEIRVRDNGTGIPQKILDKIYQPFFTTKPTGQGTGLGLSMSYDIIKAHGGELKVETKEEDGVEFVIKLPLK